MEQTRTIEFNAGETGNKPIRRSSMKKSILVALTASLLVVSGLLMGCHTVIINSSVTPQGNAVTNNYDFTGFTGVEVGGPFDTQITRSDIFKVTVTANQNLVQYITVTKNGDTLTIKTQPLSIIGNPVLKADIQIPDLRDLEISGGGHANIEGFKTTDNVTAEVSGGSVVDINMETGGFNFNGSGGSIIKGTMITGTTKILLTGGSQLEFEGNGGTTDISASGGSGLDFSQFKTGDTAIALSGGSHASVDVSGRMDIGVSGGSRLTYSGNPTIGNVEVSGGSTLNKAD